MMWFRIITLALAGQVALCQGPFERGTGSAENGADHPESAASGAPMVPASPVLKPLEPPDNRFVTLPGARVARPPRVLKQAAPTHPLVMSPAPPLPFAVPVLPLAPAVDLAQPAPESLFPTSLKAAGQTPPVESDSETARATVNAWAPSLSDPTGPATSPAPTLTTVPAVFAVPIAPDAAVPAAPIQPPPDPAAELQSESALFLQKQIGWWSLADARALLGNPEGQRPALDDNQAPNGQIYAFRDPTGRYKQLELDFDAENGNLRTVFVYPHSMTWQECRRLFGANVNSSQANKGRSFYSYIDRRLDVLVDPGGQVISLGLY